MNWFVTSDQNDCYEPFLKRAAAIRGHIGLGIAFANWTIAIRKPLWSGGEMSAINACIAICQRAGPPKIGCGQIKHLIWYFL